MRDRGKILTDLGDARAWRGLPGRCCGAAPRPELAGPVTSDPVSRLITALAADAARALQTIRETRAAARDRFWELAGDRANDDEYSAAARPAER